MTGPILTSGSPKPAAVDDLLLVAWSKQQGYRYRRVLDITAYMEGDEFYWAWLACFRVQPEHTLARLADIPQYGGWNLLNRLTLYAGDNNEQLIEHIVKLFVQQLRTDLATHAAGQRVSDCATYAPRLRSATDRRTGLAKQVSRTLHPPTETAQSWAYKPDYRRTLRHLGDSIRAATEIKRPGTLRHAGTTWTAAALAAPISEAVRDPKPEPVIPCEATELEPLLDHLRRKASPSDMMLFPRGAHMPDGRLDLCKQVVGPAGIAPLLDSLQDNPTVSRLLLGNNIVGSTGAKHISNFIAARRSKLKVWYIAGNQLDADAITLVCDAIAKDPRVEGLWLKRNPIKPEGAKELAALLASHPALLTLDLVNTGLLDQGTETLFAALNKRTPLKHLYLGTNGVTPAGTAAVANYVEERCNLESLFLSCNRLGDEGAARIASALTNNTSLTRLGLASNRISADGASELFRSLRTNTSLRYLDLGWTRSTVAVGELGNQIGNRGCRMLAELLGSNSTLMSIDISHNQISQSAIDDISDALDDNQSLVELRLPQYGKAINHDSLARLSEKLKRNQERLFENDAARLLLISPPKPTQEILSVYRTA